MFCSVVVLCVYVLFIIFLSGFHLLMLNPLLFNLTSTITEDEIKNETPVTDTVLLFLKSVYWKSDCVGFPCRAQICSVLSFVSDSLICVN